MFVSKIDQDLGFVQKALNARALRQEVLASNLANADTPNYKAREVDFSAALSGAKSGLGGGLTLSLTDPGHMAGTGGGSALGNGLIKYRSAVQPSLDGNTVDKDVERAAFTENSLHYQFLLERARGVFQRMANALEGTK
jgi:flagellar basal-body rod protein FlgB